MSTNTLPMRRRVLDAQLLSSIIDYLPMPIFMKDENSAFVLSNRRHAEMVGKIEEELLGNTTNVLMPQDEADKSRERDLPVLLKGEENISRRDYTFKDGRAIYNETRKARLFDSEGNAFVLGVSIDLSEQRQRESHLRAITDSVPVGVIEVVQGQGAIYANELALAYTQLDRSENPLDQILAKLSHQQPDFPGEKQKFEVTVAGEGAAGKRLLVRSSGWITIPYKAERAAVVSLTDLSEVAELRRENDEINRLNGELQDKLKQLREAQNELVAKGRLEQLGHLTATIAHELRNPLGAVSTSAFLLQRKLQAQNPGTEAQFARVANGVKRCNDIITQLLDFARVRKLDMKPVAVDDWLGGVVAEECRKLSNALNVLCDLQLGDATVAMDSARMSRAVINVLHNAAEALTGKAGQAAEVETADPTIAITSRLTDRGCEIVITDNGPGMTEEVLTRIREPLFTTKNFGTGLGVPAVEKILEQHQGGVDIASEHGKGSTFTLWWPRKAAA